MGCGAAVSHVCLLTRLDLSKEVCLLNDRLRLLGLASWLVRDVEQLSTRGLQSKELAVGVCVCATLEGHRCHVYHVIGPLVVDFVCDCGRSWHVSLLPDLILAFDLGEVGGAAMLSPYLWHGGHDDVALECRGCLSKSEDRERLLSSLHLARNWFRIFRKF